MRAAARLARALLAAFYAAADHEVDTDRGFIERAEFLLESEGKRWSADAVTPPTQYLNPTLPPITRVTFVGNGHQVAATGAEERQAEAS